ncbi:dynamin family protein [Oscillatoria sp. FACHB-1407]|uniref:dynamin family protein n=1 Tax=Oscillatoria sp. FACHB-1407 TaxID=2692847 RepID=UPI0016835E88|nr:dynamin family protein [Oscillatoria sp. FACHB-1407]MBD2460505.1 dynamin family protein [Oscillatoria sp. FACHB-1407]
MEQDTCHTLLNHLQAAVSLLELPADAPLRREVNLLANVVNRSSFRIAVFAPFNYGKSTLLNALLGERALPIDLIPTTGAAIAVRYGTELRSRIAFRDGAVIDEAGTDILKQFAILDGDAKQSPLEGNRRMREDVVSVEVTCPHPFLQLGVELIDLPGTNDQEALDALVRDQLLTADLVIQVLDGRKLMTLGEREHLRDWLLDRGISTVVFVVNFLNLLEPEDQKQVYNRLRFVAESFRAKLPPGVSNLYRVDALPALRARLKGDVAEAQAAGLPMFEAALQQIVHGLQGQPSETRLPRLQAIATQVRQALRDKMSAIAATAPTHDEKELQRVQIKRKAQGLIQKGFSGSVDDLRQWLSLSNLLDRYHAAATLALKQFEFTDWVTHSLKPDWTSHQRSVVEWVYKACEFFGQARPADLWVTFPEEPTVVLPNAPQQPSKSSSGGVAPVAIATGLGWVFGGPIGAAVLGGASYLINKSDGTEAPNSSVSADALTYQVEQLYRNATQDYLNRFSTTALSALQRYEAIANPIINCPIPDPPAQDSHQHYQIQLIQSALENLGEG